MLGSLLFIVFINDLEGQIADSNLGFFADDTRSSKRVAPINHTAELQEYLETVIRWFVENNMKLHQKKNRADNPQSHSKFNDPRATLHIL